MVATPGFGLGIDKAGVHFVHHLQPPLSMSTLQQQLGRGRGVSGAAIKCNIWVSIITLIPDSDLIWIRPTFQIYVGPI
jgi:hypothetical protein